MARRTADQDAKDLRKQAADAEARLGQPQPSAVAIPPMAPPPAALQPQAAAPVEPTQRVPVQAPAQPVAPAQPAPAAAAPAQTPVAVAATETPEQEVARLKRELEEAKATGSRAFQKIRGDLQRAQNALQTGRAVQVQPDGSILLFNEPSAPRQSAPVPAPAAPVAPQQSEESTRMRAALVETYGEDYVRQHEGVLRPLIAQATAEMVAQIRSEFAPYVGKINQIESTNEQLQVEQVNQTFDVQLSASHPDWKALIEGPDGQSPDPEFHQWLYAHEDSDEYADLIFPGQGKPCGTVKQHARILKEFKTANPRAVANRVQENVQANRAAAAAAAEQPRMAPAAPVVGAEVQQPLFASEILRRQAELANNPKAFIAFAATVRQAEANGMIFDDLRDAGQPYRGAAPAA